ncbi:ankyrin repeat-containing domain protein, partial [Xylariomycetidae sp. FL0641]
YLFIPSSFCSTTSVCCHQHLSLLLYTVLHLSSASASSSANFKVLIMVSPNDISEVMQLAAGDRLCPLKAKLNHLSGQFATAVSVLIMDSIKGRNGYSVLHAAAANGRLVNYLLSEEVFTAANQGRRRAFVTKTDNEGNTAFHTAVKNAKNNIYIPLIQNGSTVDEVNSAGWTALHLAVAEERLATTAWLIQRGASVDATTRQGNTALHLAAKRDWFQGVLSLLDKHANPAIRNNLGLQPIHVADVLANDAAMGAFFQRQVTLQPPYPEYDWDSIHEDAFE